jgi:hypothetical protein
MGKFKAGDHVKWTSKSGGYEKTKRGIIVEVIWTGLMPNEDELIIKYNATSAYGGGLGRDHESYIVLVTQPGNRKSRLYWPKVCLLEKE